MESNNNATDGNTLKDKVLHLLRTTDLTNSQIAKECGTTRQTVGAIKKKHFQRGLGDKVADAIEATGLDKLVKAILEDDCGCEERKARLNMIGGLKVVNCLDNEEREYLTNFFATWPGLATPPTEDWKRLQRIRERVFSLRFQNLNPTCAPCVIQVTTQMKKLIEGYNE